jgi:hypothetical protein
VAGAASALDACGITNFAQTDVGSTFGIEVVTGMALVTPGRDANKYAPIGNSPDIKTDLPAWVITTNGWLTLGPFAAGPAENPTCVVVVGDWSNPQWYITGDQKIGEVIVTPLPQPSPVMELPALAP